MLFGEKNRRKTAKQETPGRVSQKLLPDFFKIGKFLLTYKKLDIIIKCTLKWIKLRFTQFCGFSETESIGLSGRSKRGFIRFY